MMLVTLLSLNAANAAYSADEAVQVSTCIGTINSLPRTNSDEPGVSVWDGSGISPEGFSLDNGAPSYKGSASFTHLSSPRLVTLFGQKANIVIGADSTTYLEPVQDQPDLYRAIQMNEAPTVSFACTVNPEKDEAVTIQYKLQTNVLVRRERIAGLNLEAGRPVFQKTTVENKSVLRFGEWLIQRVYPSSDNDECMVILLKIEPFDPSKQPGSQQ